MSAGMPQEEGGVVRTAIVVAFVLCFVGLASADMTGAYVTLSAPGQVVPGQAYTFTFFVHNGSTDGESITNVQVVFPDGFTLFPATMSYVPIVAGRPSWDMIVPPIDHTAQWLDNNGGVGEIFPTEGTTVSIDVTVADVLYGIPIFWCVDGDGVGAEPHQNCGCFDLTVNPVDVTSWSSIKALYH